jgi:fumarate hydratase subunit alpha
LNPSLWLSSPKKWEGGFVLFPRPKGNRPLREIGVDQITRTVRDLVIQSGIDLPEDLIAALERGLQIEGSPTGRQVLTDLIENAKIARRERLPACQDTGVAILFLEIGQEVRIIGGDLPKALEEGVRQGYRDGYFRKSTLDPLERINFGDNTPPIVHWEMVPGGRLKIGVMSKGFGGENMSQVKLYPPSVGLEGLMDEVVNIVFQAGANACPPVIVGVGIGGDLEKAALIAKKSLFRRIGQENPKPEIAGMERDLLRRINDLGIGPAGLGGRVTALAVFIETFPTHIASLPLAVNIQCNSHRHKEAVL